MSSGARQVDLPARDASADADHRRTPRRTAADRRLRRIVLGLGLVVMGAAVAFPLAPVVQPEVTYSWTAADGPAAIPLMPYQPVQLRAGIDCASALGDRDGLLLATVPPRPDPAAEPLFGLTLTVAGGELGVTSAGVDLGTVALPRDCTISVRSDPARTTVLVDGAPVLTRDGDVRPDVAGAFSDARSGIELTLTTDTRFQTTISPLKLALGALCALALLGLLAALLVADRRATPAVRLLPRGWWRPRVVDGAVVALLGTWWIVGALTVDDGYIAGIVRSTGSNGFVGNVYRWLNAPEAPFSWFYEIYHAWSLVSSSTLWMRLPSTLLGLLAWVLLSRGVLPRLGRFARAPGPWTAGPWLAALAFGTWWIPFNLGLRPEPWVAVGGIAVFLAVERAVATRRVLPMAVGLVLAGAVTALTPAGLVAFVPFLAAALPLLRLVRARRDLLVAPLLAAPASAVLLMTYDQSLAGVLEATRVRAVIGGGLAWYQEYERYAALLEPGSFQSAIGRRAAVLMTLVAAVGVLVMLGRRHPGVAAGPARRLVLGFLLGLALLTVSPTKWTQHFGDLAGYGAAVLVLGLVTWTGAGRAGPGSGVGTVSGTGTGPRARSGALSGRVLTGGLAAVTVAAWLILAGSNTWPYVSNWYAPIWSGLPPRLAGRSVASLALGIGALVVAVLLARSAWLRAGSADSSSRDDPPAPRWAPAPARPAVLLLAAVLALQVFGLVRVSAENTDSYTLASDAAATLNGDPCGLSSRLSVETEPAAGLLPARAGPPGPPTEPVDVGGATLPGIAVSEPLSTAWFVLDAAQRVGTLPVVVTTRGPTRPTDQLYLEFAAGERVLDRRPVTAESAGPRDVRQVAPGGADAVRLVVEASRAGSGPPALVSLPRVPRLTPMSEVLPPGSAAILDWPVAFPFGCLTPEPLPLGTAGLARWRVGPPAADDAGGIAYAPALGGPFAAPRLLVTEQRMATYLAGEPLRDAAQLYRWVPTEPLSTPRPDVTDRTVTGWTRDGHARVPGLDPVG